MYLPLMAVASIVANAYGPVKYMPVTPVWKALLVSVVVSLRVLGWTTLLVQNMSSKYFTDASAWGELRVAVNLPSLAEEKEWPPAGPSSDDQYKERWPRVGDARS